MPEMRFIVRWPDDTVLRCYSPSTVVRDYLEVGRDYLLGDFVQRCRSMLLCASERVKAKFGFYCSAALDQLAEIEASAGRFDASASVTIVAFELPEAQHRDVRS